MTFQGAEFQRGCKMVENIKNEMRERIRVFKLDPCEYNDAKAEALEEMLTYIEALEKKQPKEEEEERKPWEVEFPLTAKYIRKKDSYWDVRWFDYGLIYRYRLGEPDERGKYYVSLGPDKIAIFYYDEESFLRDFEKLE